MPFVTLASLPGREVFAGITGRYAHVDRMTVGEVAIANGAVVPTHHHPHEQITTVLSGRFEMTVGGETRMLESGMTALIPSDVPHSARALSACRLLNIFSPVRENYR